MFEKIAQLLIALEKIQANYKLTVENGKWKIVFANGYCDLNNISKIETKSDFVVVSLGDSGVLTIYKDTYSYQVKGASK